MNINWLRIISFTLCVLGMTATYADVYAQQISHSRPEEILKNYLQNNLDNDFKDTQYHYAFVDLNGDKKPEVVVYVSGSGWCGSGGCRMLILTPQGNSYREVTATTITRPPIRILPTKTNGWSDLSVYVAGGGILSGYISKLSFNGRTYPSNPSMVPARRVKGRITGKIIITGNEKDTLLYP